MAAISANLKTKSQVTTKLIVGYVVSSLTAELPPIGAFESSAQARKSNDYALKKMREITEKYKQKENLLKQSKD